MIERRGVSYTSFEIFCTQILVDYVLHDMTPENLELVSNSTTSELPTQPTCLAFFLLLFGGALRLTNSSFIFLLMLSYLHTTLISSGAQIKLLGSSASLPI